MAEMALAVADADEGTAYPELTDGDCGAIQDGVLSE